MYVYQSAKIMLTKVNLKFKSVVFSNYTFCFTAQLSPKKNNQREKYQTQLKVNENNALRQLCDRIDFYNESEGY